MIKLCELCWSLCQQSSFGKRVLMQAVESEGLLCKFTHQIRPSASRPVCGTVLWCCVDILMPASNDLMSFFPRRSPDPGLSLSLSLSIAIIQRRNTTCLHTKICCPAFPLNKLGLLCSQPCHHTQSCDIASPLVCMIRCLSSLWQPVPVVIFIA